VLLVADHVIADRQPARSRTARRHPTSSFSLPICLLRADFELRAPLAARRNPLAGAWNSVEQLVFISISINKCLTI
jgi:hypothetical protein